MPEFERQQQGSNELAVPKTGEQDHYPPRFWNQFIETASTIPQGYDTVTWPVRMLDELHIRIADWRASKYYPDYTPPKPNVAGETLNHHRDSLQRIKTAYEIIGYTYVKSQPEGVFPWHVASSLRYRLKNEQDLRKINTVRLTNSEAAIVQRLCEAPRYSLDEEGRKMPQPAIPVNPQRRVYQISDVLAPEPRIK